MYDEKHSPSGYVLVGLPTYKVLKPYIEGHPWFVLKIQQCNHRNYDGRQALYYKLEQVNPDKSRELLFEGDDIFPARSHDRPAELIREAVFWLTMKPGDTDKEFFKDHTERQLQFCSEHAEALSMFAKDPAERRHELKAAREWDRKHGAERNAYREAARRGEY